MNKDQKIVVFGGYGFLGSHVVKELHDQGEIPVILSRRTGCDMRSFESVFEHLKREKPDTIINCAAHVGSVHYAMKYSADMIHDNLLIITNLYRAALHACPKARIINPISNCSYPGEANIHSEPDWQLGAVHDSVLAYASTRRMIYALAKCYADQYKMKSINWIVANAYGPGDYTDPNKVHALNGIIIRLIQAKKTGAKTFEIWGSGKPTREWVFIKDAAKMLAHSLQISQQLYPVNFAQNTAYSVSEIAAIAAKILKYPVTFTYNTQFADGAPTKILDDTQFRKRFPDFQFTPLRQGIQETIKYYQKLL